MKQIAVNEDTHMQLTIVKALNKLETLSDAIAYLIEREKKFIAMMGKKED